MIQKIIKLDTQSKLQKSELSKYRVSPNLSHSPANKSYVNLRGLEVSNQKMAKIVPMKNARRNQ